ncbi:hypothetical protein RJ640_011770 [Escallonia rubra]|uniref:DNA topoisomerase I n=1 Tax=Escallonia rubra TaxID=112253 RepID=A0AA88QS61_9ASTE|nr:hypothetical protein RJ640_011770 [Escallonia rubra]
MSDEDDEPLVFKRSNAISKQTQQDLDMKMSSSQKHDGKSGRQVSNDEPLVFRKTNTTSKAIQRDLDMQMSSSQKHDGKSGRQVSNDEPLVFRKTNTTSKAIQRDLDMQMSSFQKHDGKSGRQVSDIRLPSGECSSIQNGKIVPSAKLSSLKSSKAPIASAKATPLKSHEATSNASTSAADQSKQSSQHNAASVIVEERPPSKPAGEPNHDSEDSEDEKPLSCRISRGASNITKKKSGTYDNKHEDPDDEAPLSSKFSMKSSAAASTSKSINSDGNKVATSKLQQNGSVLRDNQLKRSSTALGEAKSAVKKPKLSDGSKPAEMKQVGMKAEPKVEDYDDDDDAPISQRMKSSATSGSKTSVSKPKVSSASTPLNSKKIPLKAEPKTEEDDDDDDHAPISQRMKYSTPSSTNSSSAKQKVTKVVSTSLKTNKNSKKVTKKSKYLKSSKVPPGSGEGQKWTTLVHNGVIFPPPYKPHGVKMLYKGKPVDLTPEQEEVATMFAVMLDTEYMNKPKFKENFMGDWRKILGKNHVIQNLDDCNFTPIYEWHQGEKEKKKQMSSEEKAAIKEEKLKLEEKYMWAVVDDVKEKVGNFRVEPPGLFRGRGEHPKMGKLKKRIRPSDITINIGKGAPIPECPIPGERWKEVRHDNTVTWLAFWNDPINPKEFKYVFLAASSSLKGQSDKEKYEKARTLKNYIEGIRTAYTKDFASKDISKRQIAVATYLIDKLALRAGNEKDDDEADTVGCCTLKVENVEPKPPNILKFDFLGKDSIRYQNEVEVEVPVYKAIQQFRSGKRGFDDLFDKLDTSKLNAHLKELMPGLTAKVFRTYNASITLDEMLSKKTNGGDVAEKVVVYQHANKEVAIICNHQRTVSKSHSAQMLRLNDKIDELKGILKELETDLSRAKKGRPPLKNADGKSKRNLNPEALERKIAQTNAKIEKMERDKETKEDLKTVALGTSKINYLDPRITVAWCKRNEVPMEKIFNKSLLAKFAWAMYVDPSFRF